MRADGSSQDLQCLEYAVSSRGVLGSNPLTRCLVRCLVSLRASNGNAGRLCLAALDQAFEVSARQSTLGTEVWAGCVAFMTMSYIMLVNPVLLDSDNLGDVPSFEALLTGTALSAGIGCILVGVLGNAPLGLIPGFRMNIFFVYSFAVQFGLSWGDILSCCFVSGALMLCLAVLGVVDWLARTVLTDHLKKALTVAMGMFQAKIGFDLMGLDLIVDIDQNQYIMDMDVHSSSQGLLLALAGLGLISGLLVTSHSNGALLVGIAASAIGAWALGICEPPGGVFAAPDFGAVAALDFSGWGGEHRRRLTGLVVGTLAMLFMGLFDVAGVQYGLYSIAGLLGRASLVPRGTWIVSSTALGTMVGALLGCGPLVIANESSAGIFEGARTGLSAVVIGVLFTFSAFLTPLLTAMPDLAASGPLIIIGVFMMEPSRQIAWDNLRVAIPSFTTIILVPHSLHYGMAAAVVVDMLLGLLSRCCTAEAAMDVATARAAARRLEQDAARSPLLSPADSGGRCASPAGYYHPRRATPIPHSFGPMQGPRLGEEEKYERARQLLHDLGPPPTGMQASETWEMALCRSLEMYVSGVGRAGAPPPPHAAGPRRLSSPRR